MSPPNPQEPDEPPTKRLKSARLSGSICYGDERHAAGYMEIPGLRQRVWLEHRGELGPRGRQRAAGEDQENTNKAFQSQAVVFLLPVLKHPRRGSAQWRQRQQMPKP